jgi:hypothetical protein
LNLDAILNKITGIQINTTADRPRAIRWKIQLESTLPLKYTSYILTLSKRSWILSESKHWWNYQLSKRISGKNWTNLVELFRRIALGLSAVVLICIPVILFSMVVLILIMFFLILIKMIVVLMPIF